VIRISPRRNRPGYDIPPDNSFVGQDGVRPEIWAKGLRNPWGFCRDPATGDLWTADVGNETMEEIDRIPAGHGGLNLGWHFIEGTQVIQDGAPQDAVAPVWAYRHDEVGPAAIGGCFYHGDAIPALAGAYLFADMSGPTFAIGKGDNVVRLPLSIDGIVTGFGVGPDEEIIVLTLTQGAFRLAPG
jgi:glucose/arabinose dehydrogenase